MIKRTRVCDHRGIWLARLCGTLTCAICGVDDHKTIAMIDIDHIIPLEDGGLDETWNTQPLCRDCHTIKNAVRVHTRHITGRSARNESGKWPGWAPKPTTPDEPAEVVYESNGFVFYTDERIPRDEIAGASVVLGSVVAKAYAA